MVKVIPDESGFEDEERLDIIKDLILEEEAIGEPVIFKITVLQSIIEYEYTAFESEDDFRNAVVLELQKLHPFSPRRRRQLNEGFFQFSEKGNEFSCYYIREMPFRWDYVNVKAESIQSLPVKRVDPSYRVKIDVSFEKNKVVASFFGGTETLVFRARDMVCDAVKEHVYDFAKKDVRFSPKAMQDILASFRRHVVLINIDPRDNEKFSKIVEQEIEGKAEIRRVIIYDVSNVRLTGISITISPEVTRLIKEEGIRLTKLRGGLWLESGIKISTEVNSNGRVEFVIPSKYFGGDEERIYETAVRLYRRLIPSDLEPEKGPLERFL